MDHRELDFDMDWELPEEFGDLTVDQILQQYWEENTLPENPEEVEEESIPETSAAPEEAPEEKPVEDRNGIDNAVPEKTIVFQAVSAPAIPEAQETAQPEDRPSLADILSEYFRDNPEEISEPEPEWLPEREEEPETEPEQLPEPGPAVETPEPEEEPFPEEDEFSQEAGEQEQSPIIEREEQKQTAAEADPFEEEDYDIRDILREYRDYSFVLSEDDLLTAAPVTAEQKPVAEETPEAEYRSEEDPAASAAECESEEPASAPVFPEEEPAQEESGPETITIEEEEPLYSIHEIMAEFSEFAVPEESEPTDSVEDKITEAGKQAELHEEAEAEPALPIPDKEEKEEEIVKIPKKNRRVVWEDFPETTLVNSIDDIVALQAAAEAVPELQTETETEPVDEMPEEPCEVPEEEWNPVEPNTAVTQMSDPEEDEEAAWEARIVKNGENDSSALWLDAIVEEVQEEEPFSEEAEPMTEAPVETALDRDEEADEEDSDEPAFEEKPWFMSLLQPESEEAAEEDDSETMETYPEEEKSLAAEAVPEIESEKADSEEKQEAFIDSLNDILADDSVYSESPEEALSEQKKESRASAKWEKFPETENAEEEPFVDNMDYAALFKMFTEPQEETPAPSEHEETEESLPALVIEDQHLSDEANRQPEKPAPEITEEPLLAQDEYSYLDILREFMLGDQHPIFADVPGADTDLSAEKLPEIEEADAEEPEPFSRRRRPYAVEESFPDDIQSGVRDKDGFDLADYADIGKIAALEAEARKLYDEQLPHKVEETDLDAGGFESLDDAGKITQQDPGTDDIVGAEASLSLTGKAANRIQGLLAGFGWKKETKKPLNAPAAYVGFEDYLPDPDDAAQAEAGEIPEDTDETLVQEKQLVGAHESPASEEPEGLPADEPDEDVDDTDPAYLGEFPSFREYVAAEFTGLLIRIHGVGARGGTATMEDDKEDLGEEVSVAAASKYYGAQITSLRMRFQIGMVVLGVLAYLTLGLPVTGMLRTAKVAAGMCLGLQLCIMLLCLDVLVNAAVNLTRRKLGADALAGFACVITSLDALVLLLDGFGTPHTPLCLFSSAALMGILCSSLLTSRALRRSMRVPAIGKRAYCVTAEEDVRGKDITLLKSVRPLAGFVRRSEEAPPDEALYQRISPLMLLASLLFAAITVAVKHAGSDFLYVFSALVSAAVPVTALLAFALPFFIGTQRIFSSGAAIAGWSGINDIGNSRNLIVTDRDLFPEEAIEIDTVRIFADESAEKIISYAGTMITASGSGLSAAFGRLMENNGCRMRQVEEFQCLSGGGLQGRIEDHLVLCGNSDLMRLMDVKIPYRLVDKTTVLLAIDGVLYGIFHIVYNGLPQVKAALIDLIRSNRHPIFAIRDFNVTPEMLHDIFDIATDGYDFPPYSERFRISEATPSEKSKIAAVVCREGLGPLTHVADTGRSMYVAIRINLIVTAVASLLGILLVFIRLAGAGILSPWVLFAVMAVETIVVALVSLFMRF